MIIKIKHWITNDHDNSEIIHKCFEIIRIVMYMIDPKLGIKLIQSLFCSGFIEFLLILLLLCQNICIPLNLKSDFVRLFLRLRLFLSLELRLGTMRQESGIQTKNLLLLEHDLMRLNLLHFITRKILTSLSHIIRNHCRQYFLERRI